MMVSMQTDPVESHRQFKKEHKLPFTLLSDLTVLTIKHYNALHAPSTRPDVRVLRCCRGRCTGSTGWRAASAGC